MLSRGQRNFPSFFLASQYWKTSWVTHSALQNISVIETFYAWERKIKFFCRIILVSQYRRNWWWPLLSFRLFGISKTFMHITVFFRFFCLTVPKNFVRNHLMFQKVPNVKFRKKLWVRTEYHDFPSKIFLAQSPEKIRWGTLRNIGKVRLSKNFMIKRLITLFSVDFFSRTPPLKFIGEPLCV